MPQKHSNPVAVERRMDLASLFCMIGRHGPAVALAVIAMVSVVAGFIIYRTVRGKRRKATAAAADSRCKSPGEERDASVIQPSSVESTVTDVSDEGLSDMTEDVDLIHSDLKIRHRAAAAAAAEKQLLAYSPPKIDIQIRDNKCSSDDAKEMPYVWDSYKEAETCEQEAGQSLQSESPAVAEKLQENTVDCHQGAKDEITDDVIKEVRDDVSCLKEPEQMNDENYEEKVKVSKAECHDDEDVITDEDVSDKKKRQEDEKCALINPQCFEQTPCVSKNSDDDRLQDNKSTVETSTSEQETHMSSTQPEQCDHVMDEVIHQPSIQGSDWDEDRSQGNEVIEDIINEDQSSKLTAVAFDAHLPHFDKQGGDIGQNGLLCNPEDGVLYAGADQVKEEMLASDDIVASSEECHSSCVALTPVKVHTLDDDVAVVLTGGKPQILADTTVPDLPPDCHQLQKDEITPTLDEDDDSAIRSSQMLLHETGNQPENNENGTSMMMVEEHSDHVNDPQVQSCCEDQQMTKNEDFDTAAPDLVVCDGESSTTPVMAEKISHPHVSASVAAEPDTSDPGAASLTDEEISCAHNPSTCQDQQGDHIEKVETFDETRVHSATDADACTNATLTEPLTYEDKSFSDTLLNNASLDEIRVNTATDAPTRDNAIIASTIISEETSQPEASSSSQDKQSDHMENNETLDEMKVHICNDAPAHDSAAITSPIMYEETSHSDMLLSSQDQQRDHTENSETFDETRVDSTTDALASDSVTTTSTIMSEETSQPEMMPCSPDQQSDQTKNNKDSSEVTTIIAAVVTEDICPPLCLINLTSLEQSELNNNDISSPSVGEESGISSMAVSPDLQVAGNDFNVNVENMVPTVMDSDLQYAGQKAAQNNLFNDDVAPSVTNVNTAGMVFGPYPSQHSQPPQSKNAEWTKYESFVVNEDTFGHEIEDKYHKVMEQFMAQMTTSVASFSDELKEQTDMKVIVEVSEIKKAGVSVKKEATKGEKEEEEDYEKTEISIMEATMDNNEWITDSNYQTLPWMNLSAPSFAQDHKKTNQLPTEEHQYSTAQTEDTCVDSIDIHPSTEDTQNSTLSAVDENMENNKKVVAVQPMTQRVNVTFRVHYFIQSPYQKVAVTGNQQELGNWKGFIPLERAKDGHWAGVVSLPADTHVEWKFVIVDKGEVCRWEECGNRLLDTGYGDDLLVRKWWGYL